ncbi:hypothetical protein KC349_g7917 [Hortaea werneckii]|nr:hypothetical protein KC349_g7917 [Hortaea werneckii]
MPREVPNNQTVDPSILQPRFDRLRLDSYDKSSYSSYTTPRDPTQFFVPGKVFLAPWTAPADTTTSTRSTGLYLGDPGPYAFSLIRRFIVVRSGPGYCSAIPIVTYGGKGVAKTGVNKHEHCIVYTGTYVPTPLREELPSRGELPMQPTPIRVNPDNMTEKLDPTSRIDLGRVSTVQYNVKVKAFGIVHWAYMQALHSQFCAVWRLPLSEAHTTLSAPGRLQQPLQSGIYDEANNEATDEDDEISEDDDQSGDHVDGPVGQPGGQTDTICEMEELVLLYAFPPYDDCLNVCRFGSRLERPDNVRENALNNRSVPKIKIWSPETHQAMHYGIVALLPKLFFDLVLADTFVQDGS